MCKINSIFKLQVALTTISEMEFEVQSLSTDSHYVCSGVDKLNHMSGFSSHWLSLQGLKKLPFFTYKRMH